MKYIDNFTLNEDLLKEINTVSLEGKMYWSLKLACLTNLPKQKVQLKNVSIKSYWGDKELYSIM